MDEPLDGVEVRIVQSAPAEKNRGQCHGRTLWQDDARTDNWLGDRAATEVGSLVWAVGCFADDTGTDAAICTHVTDVKPLYRAGRETTLSIRGTGPANRLTTRIAEPALLVAVKLYSGRPQDARDAVAVAAETDIERDGSSPSTGRC